MINCVSDDLILGVTCDKGKLIIYHIDVTETYFTFMLLYWEEILILYNLQSSIPSTNHAYYSNKKVLAVIGI